MTDRPDVGGDSIDLCVGQVYAALRRHGTGVLFRRFDTFQNCLLQPRKTAVAPEPFADRQIGADRTADTARTVAACACRASFLAVEDLFAERHPWKAMNMPPR